MNVSHSKSQCQFPKNCYSEFELSHSTFFIIDSLAHLYISSRTLDLRKAGICVWTDEAEIKIEDSLIEKIREGIDKVDYLAIIISKNSIKSEGEKKEVDIAMNQEIRKKWVKVLLLLIEKCDLHIYPHVCTNRILSFNTYAFKE